MTDYAAFRLGGLTSPVTTAGSNTLLQDADPALYWFLQWCKGVIDTHVGPRWDAEVAAAGLALQGKIVQQTIPYDPIPLFQEAQFALPLLAVHRLESDFKEATAAWIRRSSIWCLDYVLPPLTPAQLERLWPATAAIEAALFDRINQDGDPAVLSGQRLKDLMQTEYIKPLQARPSRGWIKSNATQSAQSTATQSQMLFPALYMRFEVAERTMPVTYPAITGMDINTSVSNGSTSVDIADASKNNP